jgi:hypothetical protein
VTKLNPAGSGLVYSTYLCGGGATGIAVDPSGDAYVTGAAGAGFPTTPGAYQTTYRAVGGGDDAFVTKLNPAGSGLVYSTYLGAVLYSSPGIAIDPSGDAYVAGSAGAGFPTTPGAYQTTYRGLVAGADAFVTKLNPAGSGLVYSTYLGNSGKETGNGIAVDPSGDAYVTGQAGAGFPTTPGAYQTTLGSGTGIDAFETEFSPAGDALLYSTYLYTTCAACDPDAASGAGIAVDAAGDAYVTGSVSGYPGFGNVFIARFAPGADVLWALRVSPRTFVLSGRLIGGHCVAASHSNRHHPACTLPVRLGISYQLSAAASIRITITRVLPGRMVNGGCVKPNRTNRNRRACNRLIPMHGALTVNSNAGINSFSFNGRIGGHNLAAGHYQLTAIMTTNGEAGTPQTVSFGITG